MKVTSSRRARLLSIAVGCLPTVVPSTARLRAETYPISAVSARLDAGEMRISGKYFITTPLPRVLIGTEGNGNVQALAEKNEIRETRVNREFPGQRATRVTKVTKAIRARRAHPLRVMKATS